MTVDWTMDISAFQSVPGSDEHICEARTLLFPAGPQALSLAVFGRADWLIMFFEFAGLWSEVLTKRVTTDDWSLEALSALLRSGSLSSIAADYIIWRSTDMGPLP